MLKRRTRQQFFYLSLALLLVCAHALHAQQSTSCPSGEYWGQTEDNGNGCIPVPKPPSCPEGQTITYVMTPTMHFECSTPADLQVPSCPEGQTINFDPSSSSFECNSPANLHVPTCSADQSVNFNTGSGTFECNAGSQLNAPACPAGENPAFNPNTSNFECTAPSNDVAPKCPAGQTSVFLASPSPHFECETPED